MKTSKIWMWSSSLTSLPVKSLVIVLKIGDSHFNSLKTILRDKFDWIDTNPPIRADGNAIYALEIVSSLVQFSMFMYFQVLKQS